MASNKTHSGARLAARTLARVLDVRTGDEQSSPKYTRRLSQEAGISKSCVMRVTHSDLKLFPYKVRILQAQSQARREPALRILPEY